jgi:hypothetical protein
MRESTLADTVNVTASVDSQPHARFKVAPWTAGRVLSYAAATGVTFFAAVLIAADGEPVGALLLIMGMSVVAVGGELIIRRTCYVELRGDAVRLVEGRLWIRPEVFEIGYSDIAHVATRDGRLRVQYWDVRHLLSKREVKRSLTVRTDDALELAERISANIDDWRLIHPTS